jgi:hypothetical protein
MPLWRVGDCRCFTNGHWRKQKARIISSQRNSHNHTHQKTSLCFWNHDVLSPVQWGAYRRGVQKCSSGGRQIHRSLCVQFTRKGSMEQRCLVGRRSTTRAFVVESCNMEFVDNQHTRVSNWFTPLHCQDCATDDPAYLLPLVHVSVRGGLGGRPQHGPGLYCRILF